MILREGDKPAAIGGEGRCQQCRQMHQIYRPQIGTGSAWTTLKLTAKPEHRYECEPLAVTVPSDEVAISAMARMGGRSYLILRH